MMCADCGMQTTKWAPVAAPQKRPRNLLRFVFVGGSRGSEMIAVTRGPALCDGGGGTWDDGRGLEGR